MINTDSKKIDELLSRGVEEIIDENNLRRKLVSGKKLRIKFGIDPTGPKIHIGRAISLWKLRAFQEMGHQIILIIGDFTARIGDASDKQALRPALEEKEIKANMKTYLKQIGQIIDIHKTQVEYNNRWLGKLSAADLIKLEMDFTAQQMIQRRNFEERWNEGKPIGLHELNYPLFQGYDSVAIKSDVEIGGSDQLFNLKAGRELQRIFNQPPQDLMTLKMLYGLDGRKMSTSWSNVINIIDEPNDMFGKVMSMKDELIADYFELCTTLDIEEVKAIKNDLLSGKINPRDAKAKLGKEIVALYHGHHKANNAEKEFNSVFQKGNLPKDMPEIEISDLEINIVELVVRSGFAESNAEAVRLIEQKAVRINDEVISDRKSIIKVESGMILQSGKRNFARIQ